MSFSIQLCKYVVRGLSKIDLCEHSTPITPKTHHSATFEQWKYAKKSILANIICHKVKSYECYKISGLTTEWSIDALSWELTWCLWIWFIFSCCISFLFYHRYNLLQDHLWGQILLIQRQLLMRFVALVTIRACASVEERTNCHVLDLLHFRLLFYSRFCRSNRGLNRLTGWFSSWCE